MYSGIRMFGWVSMMVIIVLLLFGVQQKEEGKSYAEVEEAYFTVEQTMFNMTHGDNASLTYTYVFDPEQEYTMREFILNMVHGVMYAMIVEIFTVSSFIIAIGFKYVTYAFLIKVFYIFMAGLSVWLITRLIKPTGLVYTLLEHDNERKGKVVPKWKLWIFATAIVLVVGGVGILLFALMALFM